VGDADAGIMYGVINHALKVMVLEKFGAATW
jgi:hypothetical protein